MPPLATTLDQLMANEIARYADTPALVDSRRRLTYRELGTEAARLANVLAAEGIGRGDRVAVLSEDRVEVMPAYLAGWLVGATVVHVNARLAIPEVQYIVDDAAPTALVYTSGLREQVGKLSLSVTRFVAELDGDELGARLRAASTSPPPPSARPEDIAVIGYTSGTTGRPKGAMASHLSLTTNCRLAPFNFGLPNRARVAYSGSVAFVASFWSMVFAGLYVGGTVRFLGHYDVDTWFDTMHRDRSTWTYVPSPLMAEFAERVTAEPEILDHLQTVMHTGSLGHPAHVEAVVRAMRGRYVELYGSTEVISPVAGTSPAMYQDVPPGHKIFSSGGIALPSAQLWIVREDGTPADVGEDGYIVARSDVGFSGYLNDPAKTAATIVDGAIRTGDMGHLDEEGYLFVSGRSAELIVSGGMNVYPAEVERALLEHPDIVQAAVVGVPHERWGVTVAAAVVTRPGAVLTADDVVAWSRQQLASYKKPTVVRFLDELPQNPSRKIDKRRIREMLLAERS
jgi:fatty-acyl-CoA synthase